MRVYMYMYGVSMSFESFCGVHQVGRCGTVSCLSMGIHFHTCTHIDAYMCVCEWAFPRIVCVCVCGDHS